MPNTTITIYDFMNIPIDPDIYATICLCWQMGRMAWVSHLGLSPQPGWILSLKSDDNFYSASFLDYEQELFNVIMFILVYRIPRLLVIISNQEQGPLACDIQWAMKRTKDTHCPGEIPKASQYEISI